MFSGFKTLLDKHPELGSVRSIARPTIVGMSLYLVGLGSLVLLYCLHHEGINCAFDSYCSCTSNSYCPPPYTLRTPVPFFEGGFWLDVLLCVIVIPIGWPVVVAYKSKDDLVCDHARWIARTRFFSIAGAVAGVLCVVAMLLGGGLLAGQVFVEIVIFMAFPVIAIVFLAVVWLIWIIYREVYGLFNYVLGKAPCSGHGIPK